jgi:predicted metalloendopeptidase
MNFPAGIIQPPFFSAHYPSTWNYAALGSVMGHEVGESEGRGEDGRGA